MVVGIAAIYMCIFVSIYKKRCNSVCMELLFSPLYMQAVKQTYMIMKSLLFFLLSVVIPLQLFSQHSLGVASNLPRSGDRLQKKEMVYKSPGEKGTAVVWDFSGVENRNENYDLRYVSLFPASDTIVGIEHRTMYYYHLSGDTLFTPGYENPTMRIRYRSSEALLVFPFPYGRSLTTYFGGRGNYCNRLRIDACGKSTVTADATGLMILPGGDTLLHVLRIHTHKLVFEQTNTDPVGTTASPDTISLPVCYRDSVNLHLANDSSHIEIDTWRWYAEGYRYPVFESMNSVVCKSGERSTLFSTSFYYPPAEQYYGLNTDSENQEKRDRMETAGQSEAPLTVTSGKEDDVHGYEDEFIRYACNSNDREISLNYTLKVTSDITIGLYDVQGRQHSIMRKTLQNEGSYQQQFSLDMLARGEYLLRIVVGDKVYAEKILKQ